MENVAFQFYFEWDDSEVKLHAASDTFDSVEW